MAERTMNGVVFREYGGPEVLNYEQIPVPSPGSGEVLIRVRATSLNHGLDVQTREGRFATAITLPHVSGSDAAGEVVELGPCVEGLAIGDRVVVYPILGCGRCDVCRDGGWENRCRDSGLFGVDTWGGHAEYAVVPAANLLPLPAATSFEAAAAMTIAYTTAWHGLVTRAGLTAGDTLLVTAAGSGVGAAAIQYGRLLGARVFATTSHSWKQEKARELGAEAVFDSGEADWPDAVRELTGGRGVTIAIDNLGGESLPRTVSCLGHGGRLVCSGATTGREVPFNLVALYRHQLALHFNAQGTKSDLRTLLELAARGALEPVIDSRFGLGEMVEAHHRISTSGQFGKIVLTSE